MSKVTTSSTSSFGCRSAAHIVLAIPELLEIIFSFGTQASNVSYALVCRDWRELALNNVWREVDDMYYLLQLLTPLRKEYANYSSKNLVNLCAFSRRRQLSKTQIIFQEFSHIPTPEDWTCFTTYARRVHSLKYGTKGNEKAEKFMDSVFHDLAHTRTTLEVLPNLRSIWWNSIPTAQYATLFMHDKVTEFSFKICDTLPLLCTNIVARMPSLRSLRWTNSYAHDSHNSRNDQELLKLLSSLQELREVMTPKDALNNKILTALSLLPELEVIQFDKLGGIPRPIASLKCKLLEGAFPKLYDLCLNSDLDDIRVYLTGGALLPRLRNLSVESVHRELPRTVLKFLKNVTKCYPMLEMVSMDVIVNIADQDGCKPLSSKHLYPILSLQQLTHLELRHNQPLQISEVDLAEFGAALPALEKLVLNPEPLQPTTPKITLHSLLIIAQHFPKLFYLGIYLDAQDTIIPVPHSHTKAFHNLLTLYVGVSPIASEIPAAIFLTDLLLENERVEVRSGISWNPRLFEGYHEYMTTISMRRTKWDHVVDFLPPLLRQRKEKAHRRNNGVGGPEDNI